MATKLFSIIQIKDIIFKNRLVISPMCQYSAKDGFANDWHLVHLGSRAIGGAALIFQEATAVSPEGRISPEDLGIWSDNHIEKFKQITAFIESQNAVPGIQIAHAGRKASMTSPWKGNKRILPEDGGWETFSPSDVAYKPTEFTTELSIDGIKKVISDFRAAAKRSLEAGYKVLEIHAAHGYLLHQFLSPLSNFRKDEYGGDFYGRIKIVLEIVEEVKKEWPDNLPLFVRISATDWASGGWNEEESIHLSAILKAKGVDVIDVSSGGNVPHQQIPVQPNYQVSFAENIKKQAKITTGAVGLITNAIQAEAILQDEKADFIFIARESLRNPNLGLTFAHDLNEEPFWPKQYERAQPK
ncbi:oxidoreductase [Flavobacterium sp. NST-5]|uniref:Oxidoreductase n=1 Tax=Flavobacterium ichthyis TaxID=2698827 RepID=A0ABW9Z7Y3_9FLAO|nr:NADH:flavin oxidoreductase/NADH oxidase [Flavobacterium ichthyis]NBL64988.1 oxidoreductase [Flavobacterium ichthyis]